METSPNIPLNSAMCKGTIFQLADGSIQGCDRNAEKILGYSAGQLTKVDYFNSPWRTIDLSGADFPADVHPAIVTIRTSQPSTDVVMGFYQPDGKLVWLLLNSQPLFQKISDQPYGVVTTIEDISKNISKSSNQVPDSKLLLSQFNQQSVGQLADVVPGVIYLFDTIARRNIYVNSQTEDLLGYTSEQVLAMGADFPLQMMHPDDLLGLPQQISKLEQSAEGEVCKFEYRMRHKNGEWRWFCTHDRVYTRTANGSVEQILGIARDITERKQAEIALKQSEGQLQLATVASGIGMWFWDLIEDTLEWTELGKAIFGLPKGDEFSFETCLNVIHPNDRDRTLDAIDRALTNKTEYNAEYRVIWSDGSVHWIVAKGRAFYAQNGEPFRMMGTVQDITAAKQSAQQLEERSALLKFALSNAQAGTWDWDIEKQEVTWSPENYQLYGIDPNIKPLHYQDWKNTIHPDDVDRSNQEVQKVLLGKSKEFRTEFRIIHPQKGIRWLLGVGNVIYSENDEPVRLSGINLDISHLKKSQEALFKSKQQLQKIIDSLPVYIGLLTPDGRVITINQPALAVANLKLEDVFDRPFVETYWWSFSTDIQAKIADSIRQAAAGEIVGFDTLAQGSDSKLALVEFTMIPIFDSSGQVEYLVASGMNVSDREASKQTIQQREYELELITEVIPQQIWTAGLDGHIDYINQRWQDYTGLNLKQMQAEGWSIIVHPDDLPEIRERWTQAVTKGTKFDLEVRLRHKNGNYRWFLSKARPLRNEQGKIIKWYGTNTGINRIKELEAELRQQTKDLIDANRLKDDFLAIISHELRTPLNPILGWSQLLATGRLDAVKTAQGIEIIQRNAKLQTQLIDDLLDVSRILRGKLKLNITPLSLESVVESALTTVNLAADAQKIKIKTIIQPNIGKVSGDAARIQQIIWNLVSNGVKFTPSGGQVTVKLERIGDRAQIEVKDTGRGIKPEFLPYVFEKFRQAQSSSTREFGGLGLGLAIVSSLTELHDGTVTVSSPGEGQGATFSVKLPLIDIPQAQIS